MVESVGANLVSTILLAHGLLICGVSYSTFEDIRYKHFRRHVNNDDVVWFDYEKFFLSRARSCHACPDDVLILYHSRTS